MTDQDTQRLAEGIDGCPICGGCGEVETLHRDLIGCPQCISDDKDEQIAGLTQRLAAAEAENERLKEKTARLTNVNACLIEDTVRMGLARDSATDALSSSWQEAIEAAAEVIAEKSGTPSTILRSHAQEMIRSLKPKD